jgi:hypothetical protein
VNCSGFPAQPLRYVSKSHDWNCADTVFRTHSRHQRLVRSPDFGAYDRRVIGSRLVSRGAVLSLCLAMCLTLVACTELPPRTFTEFMEDAAAREGTLVRCNADRRATIDDIECANARRAAAAVALEVERARRAELEAESNRLRSELRDRIARQQAAEREAEELRRAMREAAYEAQWADPEAEVTMDAAIGAGPSTGAVDEPATPPADDSADTP